MILERSFLIMWYSLLVTVGFLHEKVKPRLLSAAVSDLVAGHGYKVNTQFIWHVNRGCDLSSHRPYPATAEVFWWKQKQTCPTTPGWVRCHSTTLTESQTEAAVWLIHQPPPRGDPSAIACCAELHKETSTLAMKCCLSVQVSTHEV